MSETTLHPTPMAKVLAKVGGRRGLVEGGIPPIVFAATNAIAGLLVTRARRCQWHSAPPWRPRW